MRLRRKTILAVVISILCCNLIVEAQAPENKKSDSCPDSPRIMRVSPKVLKAQATHSVDMQLPKDCHCTGKVVVRLLVSEDGSVKCARYKEGCSLLRKAALVASRQWMFKAMKLSDTPVKYYGDLEFDISGQTGKRKVSSKRLQ
jgi:hypothetical protein